MVGSALSLNCTYTGDNQIMLLWKSPSGDIIINNTAITLVNSNGVSASLLLQFESLEVSDAGQYNCEVIDQSEMNLITKNKQYSIVLQGQLIKYMI